MKVQLPRKHSGFTLIEILVVIAILAILGAGAWQVLNIVGERSSVSLAKTQVARLEQGVNAYKSENGDVLPMGIGDPMSSNTLYKMLSGDWEEKGKMGDKHRVYCDALAIHMVEGEESTGIPVYSINMPKSKKKHYAILDPWGNPYRYRLGYETSAQEEASKGKKVEKNKNANSGSRKSRGKKGDGLNPDFDIFSQGPDRAGNGLDKDGDNKDNISNILIIGK